MNALSNAVELMNHDDTLGLQEHDETLISPAMRVDVLERPEQLAQREAIAAALFGRPEAAVPIGRFRVLERLGQGGMATVYAAYDEQLDRKVAVKLVHTSHLASDEALERTLREARALARVSHPNVVHVYEVGETGKQLYLAMEFLAGPTLRAWLDDDAREHGWREVLAVLRQAGEGLAAAHAEGVVHRDFKPHNVMFGADGRVRVLDFGLARFGEGERRESVRPDAAAIDGRLTMSGALVGTPAYMAPEQIDGKPADVRSDVWSFCVTLFEALYGARPFHGKTLKQLTDAIVAGRIEPPEAGHGVPAWVHEVVLRGLALDPAQRYGSMRALLDALADDPTRRHRRRWATGALVGALAVGGWGVVELVDRVAEDESSSAVAERMALRAELLAAEDGVAALALALEADALSEADRGRPRIIDQALYEASAADLSWGPIVELPGVASAVSFSPAGDRVALASHAELFGFELNTIEVRGLDDGSRLLVPTERGCGVETLMLAPERLLARCYDSGELRVFDAQDGAPIMSFAGARSPELSVDGLVVATREADGVVLTSVVDGRRVSLSGLEHAPQRIEFSPAGEAVATADPNQDTRVWDTRTGELVAELPGSAALALRFFNDGSGRIATLQTDASVRIWTIADAEQQRSLLPDRRFGSEDVHDLAISPDARRIAAYVDRTIWLWDANTGELLASVVDRAQNPLDTDNPWVLGVNGAPLEFTSDGERLITRRHDGTISMVDADTGETIARSDGLAFAYALSPGGDTLAVGSRRHVEIWDAATGARRRTLDSRMPLHTVFSADGSALAAISGGDGWGTTIWRTTESPSTIVHVSTHASDVAVTLSGDAIVTVDDAVARVWASDGSERAVLRGHAGSITAIAGSLREVATAGGDGGVRVWDPSDGRLIRKLEGHVGVVVSLEFSGDGALLGGADDRGVRLWDPSSGELLATLEHPEPVVSMAFADAYVVTASKRAAYLWDRRSHELIARLDGHRSGGARLAVAARGSLVASNDGRKVRIWDARTGGLVHELDEPGHACPTLAFSPDGQRLASGGGLWRASSGELLAELGDEGCGHVEFSPDGALLGRLGGQLVDGHTGEHVGDFTPGHEHDVKSIRFMAGGARVVTSSSDGFVIRDAVSPRRYACDRLREFGHAYAQVAAYCE